MNNSSYLSTSSYAYDTVFSKPLAPNYIHLSDRFQGALLGLALTPIALSSMPGIADSFTKSVAAKDMLNAIQAGLNLNGRAHPWLSSLCILLRYHDEAPEHRYKRLAIAASREALAHRCFFSNVVGRALSGLPLTPSWLQSQQQQLATHTPDHDAIAAGAASIATCPSFHYSTCVPIAALSTRSAHCSPFTDVASTGVTINWEAALVAGLLAGAIGGRSSLPVLWQQPGDSYRWGEDLYQPADVIARATTLANTLFNQWAGRQASS